MENKENAKVTKRGTVFYNELNISLMKNDFVYAVNFSKKCIWGRLSSSLLSPAQTTRIDDSEKGAQIFCVCMIKVNWDRTDTMMVVPKCIFKAQRGSSNKGLRALWCCHWELLTHWCCCHGDLSFAVALPWQPCVNPD